MLPIHDILLLWYPGRKGSVICKAHIVSIKTQRMMYGRDEWYTKSEKRWMPNFETYDMNYNSVWNCRTSLKFKKKWKTLETKKGLQRNQLPFGCFVPVHMKVTLESEPVQSLGASAKASAWHVLAVNIWGATYFTSCNCEGAEIVGGFLSLVTKGNG